MTPSDSDRGPPAAGDGSTHASTDSAGITDALLLCGGEGSRLRADGVEMEKPLVDVCGVPMLDRVHDALAGSRVDRVHAVVSPNAPATRDRARDLACDVIETPGEGYVADLNRALDRIDGPALTAAADLPLVSPTVIDRALAVATGTATGAPSLTVCVPAALKRRLGVSVGTTFAAGDGRRNRVLSERDGDEWAGAELAPTGLNVVRDPDREDSAEAIWVSHDARLAVNVNRSVDLDVAESLCPEGG